MHAESQLTEAATNRNCPYCKIQIFETYMTDNGPVEYVEHDPLYCRRNPDRIISPYILKVRRLLIYTGLILAGEIFLLVLNISSKFDWFLFWVILLMMLFLITLGFFIFLVLNLVWTRDGQ